MSTRVMTQLLGKLGGLVLTLFLSSVVIFSALLLTPGDPVSALAGGVRPTPEMIAQIRAQYNLDDPVWLQYAHWLGGVFSGDLGRSFVYKTDVVDLIAPRIGVTLTLVVYTTVLIAIFGVGSGILAATRGRVADRAVLIATSVGMAMPTFVVAILLIWIFAQSLGWFPVYGAGDGFLDSLYHLTLPAISLAVLFTAYISRITRGALVGQLFSEHVETARVRGIPRARIFRSHVFLNASPQILAVSGATIAGLFAASAIAEQAFGLGGLGSLLTEAAARKDLPVVQIISLLLVMIFVVLNAIADIAIAVIDPDSLKTRENRMSVGQLAGGRAPAVALRAATRDPLVVAASIVLVAVAVMALFGPLMAPYDPNQLYVGPVSAAASLDHLLGTDDLGRDILSRLLVGTRASVLAPIAVVALSTVLGSALAIVSAWFGGWVGGIISRVIEVIFAIPGLVLAVLAVAMFGKGLIAPVIALSIAYLPIVARLVRAGAASELGKPYVAALRVQGVSGLATCFRHVVPALLPTVLAQATVGFGYAMLDLAAISYLGLGEQPPAADWGVMIANGQPSILAGAPEQSLFPALMVVLTVLSVNILGARVTLWAEKGDR